MIYIPLRSKKMIFFLKKKFNETHVGSKRTRTSSFGFGYSYLLKQDVMTRLQSRLLFELLGSSMNKWTLVCRGRENVVSGRAPVTVTGQPGCDSVAGLFATGQLVQSQSFGGNNLKVNCKWSNRRQE